MNRREVAVGFAWNFVFGLPNKLIFPILTIIVARLLGPEEVGVFAVLTTVLAMSDVLRDGGLGHAYIMDRDADEPSKTGAYHLLGTASGFLLGLAVFAGREAIAAYFGMPELSWGLVYVSAALVANGLTTIPAAKLQRDARFRDAGLIQTVSMLSSFAVSVPLAFLGVGFKALVWGLVARSVLYWFLSQRLSSVGFALADRAFVAATFRRSSAILAQNILYSVYTILDNALVTRLFGKAAIGYYSTAWNLGIKPVEFISFPLGSTLFVAYTKHSGDPGKFASVFTRSLVAAMIAGLPVFVGIGLFAEELIRLLYTDRFGPAASLLQMLAVYFGFRSLGTLAGSAMVATGRAKLNVVAWLAGFLVAGIGLWTQFGPMAGRIQPPWAERWGGLTLDSTVLWITLGACTAYVVTLALALTNIRPSREDWGRLRSGFAACILPVLVCTGLRMLPLADLPVVLVGIIGTLLAQLVSAGIFLGGSPFAALSKSGVKRMWNSL